ncbi:MAG TPA: AMP-binding protein [Woeseiaceae bacterium]|nr:AMP-binding protein [Woeseiaceae bacterium]
MEHDLNANSIFEAFCDAAATFGTRPFLRAPATGTNGGAVPPVSWTYGEARREVGRLQRLYAAHGLEADARVAVAFDSRPDVYLHLLALNGLGISVVPVNSGGTDRDIARIIAHSDAALVVCADEHATRFGELAGAGCRAVGLTEFCAGAERDAAVIPGLERREAALLYTSGTTGHPKGCMLSNEYFLGMGRWYTGLGGACTLTADDRLLTPLPPHHMNALCVSFMAALLRGACVVQLDRFHPSSWWRTVREEGATVIHYLGVMPAILLTLPRSGDDDVGAQVKFGFGAGCDPRHHALFEQRFGFPLLEAWSMTETGAGAVTIADREPRHVGERCIGRLARGSEHRVVDERGKDVDKGQPGELWVRARGADPRKGFFSGYYKDERATREAWAGGWFHTGDVVREGSGGLLYFVDRRKNIIRRSGENIAAVEVEAVLLAHPLVLNCAVTAVADELRGEEVFALVVPAESATEIEARALVAHCLQQLSYFKAPAYVAFTDRLPLTASQKVNRAEVRKHGAACVADSTCFDLRELKKHRRARTG